MEAFSSSNYFEEPLPDLTFTGWTTRLYRTFSAETVSEKTARTLTPVSSITRSSSSHVEGRGGSESSDTAIVIKSEGGGRGGSEDEAEGEQDAAAWKPSRRTTLVFASLCILQLMVSLDSTSIGTALSTVAQDLDGSALEAFWAGTGFLLCSTVFQPFYCALSDVFGRRALWMLSILFFFIGAVIAGVATDMTKLLVGRCIQGVGGGGLTAMSEVIITDIIPLRQRGEYYGIMNAMWSLGSVTGPILGGGFAQSVSWRWIFYINFPFIGIGLIFTLLFMRLNFVRRSLLEQLAMVDWVGTVLFVGSTTSFLVPLSWGGVQFAWDSWRTLVPLLIGTAGCVGFVFYEAFVPANPLMPTVLFRNRTTVVSYISTLFVGLILWCILYYMPLYFEAVKGYSPIITGVALFPQTFTVSPSAIVAGLGITRTGKYRWAIWAGWVVTTIGLGLFCLLQPGTSIPGWIFLNVCGGIGMGFLLPSTASAVQASVASEHVAIAIAMYSFFRSLGESLGVAIGGVIFQNRMKANLLQYPALAPRASEWAADAAGLVQIIKAMPEGQDRDDLRQAYTDSLRIIWAVCCALSGAALLISLLTRSYSIDVELNTSHGVVEGRGGAGASSTEELVGDRAS